jgi:DNA helicase HerA-like ATPase
VTFVLGRSRSDEASETGDRVHARSGTDDDPGGDRERPPQAAHLGSYRAVDGSAGAPLYLDLDRPHAALVVGKRGYGKSHTLGVLAEELARAGGVAPVVVDPMGVFDSLARESNGDPVPVRVVDGPAVDPGALDPRSWCAMLDLSPESGPGGLVWQAAAERSTVDGMRDHVADSDATPTHRRAATNHLRLAASWGVFDGDGLDARALAGPKVTVVDVSGLNRAAMNAIVAGVSRSLYRARVDDRTARLPWLLLDEAHVFFEGIAESALETLLTRGRAPGVSLVAATQRPGVVPGVAVSQSDLILSHRLTAGEDIDALRRAQPTYMGSSLTDQMPTDPGEVVVIDDSTETVHTAQVRPRDTPHAGDSPRASERL